MNSDRPAYVDFSKELNTIKEEFGPRYFASEEATQKLADLWGATCNEHGVVEGYKTEIIYDKWPIKAEIDFASTQKGYWIIGTSAETSTSGLSYAPSVWSNIGYTSHYDARYAGVCELSAFFEKAASDSTLYQRKAIKKVIAHLEAEKTPQLGLF